MDEARSDPWLPSASTFGSEETPSTPEQRSSALALCATLAFVTFLAAEFGHGQGPVLRSVVASAVTVWSLADLLTAFLLLAQFYVNGNVFLALTASAYALTGTLSWAFLLAAPGIFRMDAFTLADHKTSTYLWLIWHCTFPAVVIFAALKERTLGRIFARRKIRFFASAVVVVPIFIAIAASALLLAYHEVLPALILDGRVQPAYKFGFVPFAIALNLAACGVLLRRRGRSTSLAFCLSIAMFSAALDAFLNVGSGLFTYAWYVGKAIAVFTATVVLAMILFEIAGVYGRLERVAKIDVLTSLYNRRAFEEYFGPVYRNARRLRTKMCLLIIDVDYFKKFNDSYGHLAGDECLRRVAQAMAQCITRPLDTLARYGGEEFVVLLPDTSLAGAFVVAEHIRSVVEKLQIVVDEGARAKVTVSIGIGYLTDASVFDETVLFAGADRGLYDAKDRGRNRVILGTTDTDTPPRIALPLRGVESGMVLAAANDAPVPLESNVE
jgi:diguanylate cyclase (GGDEF)-like protein